MPSESESQRRLFGMALAIKRGQAKLSDIRDPELRAQVAKMVETMSERKMRDFASKEGRARGQTRHGTRVRRVHAA